MLRAIRIEAGELRLGDIYVTRDGETTVKREVIGGRETVAADATGDPKPAVELTCSDGTSPILLREQVITAERELRPLRRVTDADRQEFALAHAEGLHDDPRECCPECEADR